MYQDLDVTGNHQTPVAYQDHSDRV